MSQLSSLRPPALNPTPSGGLVERARDLRRARRQILMMGKGCFEPYREKPLESFEFARSAQHVNFWLIPGTSSMKPFWSLSESPSLLNKFLERFHTLSVTAQALRSESAAWGAPKSRSSCETCAQGSLRGSENSRHPNLEAQGAGKIHLARLPGVCSGPKGHINIRISHSGSWPKIRAYQKLCFVRSLWFVYHVLYTIYNL